MLRTARGAILVYLVALVILGAPAVLAMANLDKATAQVVVLLFMFVPAAAAVVAHLVTGQHIRLGRPSPRSLVLTPIPVLVLVAAYLLATPLGVTFLGVNVDLPTLAVGILTASLLAFGEELGWRGYLLPQLRRGRGYLGSNAILAVVWFLYHVPVMLVPGLYANPDIPLAGSLVLFAVAVTGFSFFVGALWEISRDVWAATLAHGIWNHAVQGALIFMFLSVNPWLMGEFGVLAAAGLAILAVVTAALTARRHAAPLDAGAA